jgi:hypothetical protein
MNFQPTIIFCAKVLAGSFFLVWIIGSRYDGREAGLRMEQQQYLQDQQAAWSREDVERALVARQTELESKRKHEEELVKALGGPVAAATKDPALNIQQMLEKIAQACAPTNTAISVTVDRFTEFDVAFVLPEPLTFTRLAGISKRFLKYGVPYVHGIRFILGNEVLARLGDAEIESVTNWSTASVGSVEELLLATSAQSQPAEAAVAASDRDTAPPEGENLSPDQLKISEAQKAFTKQYVEHVRILNELVSKLARAAQFDALQDWDLPSRIVWLDQQPSRMTDDRDFFLNQASEMEQLLNDQGLDPLLITIIKRESNARIQAKAVLIETVFDAVSDHRLKIRGLLADMESHRGEWFVDPNTGVIQFSSSAARDVYVTGSDAVKRSGTAVHDAMQSWSNRNKQE